MAETVREMVVRLSMDAGGFTKTANTIKGQITNINKELKGMGDNVDPSKLEEKLNLQRAAIDNLNGALKEARRNLEGATSPSDKLSKAKRVSTLETQLVNAKQAAADTEKQLKQLDAVKLQKLGDELTKMGGNLQRFGRKFSLYIGGPLTFLGGKAYRAALDYETALTDVAIATGKSADEMEGMDATIKSMMKTVPLTYQEIALLIGTLARAGVAEEDLESVTRVMAGLGATTDVSAEASAAAIIKFMGVMGLAIDDVDRLAATLVDLGNGSVSTGSEIFEMAQRISATGKQAGLNAVEILAISTAFSSLGISAEAGGTAAGKLMKAMQLAAETGKGLNDEVLTSGEVVMGFTTAMGMSEEQFKKSWGDDPAGTMLTFFDGLKKGADSGNDSVLAMLDAMGMTEVRLSNLIAIGASNPNFFRDMLGLGEQAWADNTALEEGVEKAYSTAQAKQDIMLNEMENAAADVGENVADVVQPVIGVISDLVGEFGKLDEGTQTMWVGISAALVALGPVAGFIGGVTKGVGGIVGWVGKIKAGDADNFTKLMGALKGPVGGWALAALGIGGVVMALNSIKSPTEQIIDKLKNIEFKVDQQSYDETMAAIEEMRAQAGLLSGEEGARNAGTSSAVQAGYGTSAMFGQALAYETALSEQSIAEISGKYGTFIKDLNAQIVAAVEAGNTGLADQLEAKRATVTQEWDAAVATEKAAYADVVGNLFAGMVDSPELAASLEQAGRDYDLFSAVTNAIEQAEMGQDVNFGDILTRDVLTRFLGNGDLRPSYANAVELKAAVGASLAESVASVGGEPVLSALWNAIMDDPGASDMLDLTKTQGIFDGWVELMDFAAAAEKASTGFGTALTPGMADAITGASDEALSKMQDMNALLEGEAARGGAAAAAAYLAAWGRPVLPAPTVAGSGTPGSTTVNNSTTLNMNGGASAATDIYKIRRELTNATMRAARGFGKS